LIHEKRRAVAGAPPSRQIAVAGWLDPSTAHQVRDERNDEQHHEDEEQDLGDAHGRAGDAAETQSARDKRDDEKDQSPPKHFVSPLLDGPLRRNVPLLAILLSFNVSGGAPFRVRLL
jgi:hypothetical protein